MLPRGVETISVLIMFPHLVPSSMRSAASSTALTAVPIKFAKAKLKTPTIILPRFTGLGRGIQFDRVSCSAPEALAAILARPVASERPDGRV